MVVLQIILIKTKKAKANMSCSIRDRHAYVMKSIVGERQEKQKQSKSVLLN